MFVRASVNELSFDASFSINTIRNACTIKTIENVYLKGSVFLFGS